MIGLPRQGHIAALKTSFSFSTTADITETLAAIENERHVIRQLVGSLSGIPIAASLRVAIAGVTVWQLSLPNADNVRPFDIVFHEGLYDKDNVNQEVVVTLGGMGIGGKLKLNVFYE